MSEPEHDPELDAFLKRRSPMHRRLSDFDHAEPSVDLDRLVLSRARAAIESPPQAPVYRATRWAMPLGLAATILIAFTLVLNIDRPEPRVAANEQVVSQASPAAAAAPSAELARVAPASPAPAVAADASAFAKAEAGKRTAEPSESRVPAAPAGAEFEGDWDGAAATGSRSRLLARASRASSSMPLSTVSGTEASAPGATPAPAPPPPPSADPHATAESWLREIERLRAAGKTAEADRELVAFREAHPAHPGYSLAKPPAR